MKPIKKILISEKETYHNIRNTATDFATKFGAIKKEDLQKAAGEQISTHMGKRYTIIDPIFIDQFKNLQRLPQTVAIKEIGHIIAATGINEETVVVDAGAGSGALASYLAKIAKKVYSYDIKEEHLAMAKENAQVMGVEHKIEFKLHNIYEGIPKKDIDVITLDVPEPWHVIKHHNALKVGGFIVSYSPCITQVKEFVNQLPGNIIHIKTVEIIEKKWKVDGKAVRPETWNSFHTGFLTFARKISNNDIKRKVKENHKQHAVPSYFEKPENHENLMNEF